MGHVCKTCGAELPSPGGLGIHELSHLAPKAKPATAPAPEPAKAAPERKAKSDTAAKAPRAPKARTRHKEKEPIRRSRQSVHAREEGEAQDRPETGRRRRRPSRAMSSGRDPFDRLLPLKRTEAQLAPAGRARRKLDSTVPLTALLVVAALVGGLVAAMTHAPTHVNVAAGEGVVRAGASAASVAGPVDEAAFAACRPAVDTLTLPSASRPVDLAELMRAGPFPALPLGGFEKPALTGRSRSDSVAEYLAGSEVIDPALWQKTLSSSGFRGAAGVLYAKGTETYRAETLRFGNAAGAVDFNRTTLSAVCAAGMMTSARPIPDVPGGISYVSTEAGSLRHRASIVLGDSVAHLSVCDCVQAPDLQALVGAWARSVVTRVNAV